MSLIEEAHNFAPEGGGRNNPASRIIQKIAECRTGDSGMKPMDGTGGALHKIKYKLSDFVF